TRPTCTCRWRSTTPPRSAPTAASGSPRATATTTGSHRHDDLAGVAAGAQQLERLGGVLEPLHHVDRVLHLPLEDPAEHLALALGEAGEVVEDEEALHPRPAGDEREVVAQARRVLAVVVRRDRTAADDASVQG